MIPGLDVYHGSGRVDWPVVFAAGYRFAYVKVREGQTYADPVAADNIEGARSAGLAVGGYHFFRPLTSVVSQIEAFANDLRRMGGKMLMPAIDFEWCGKIGAEGKNDWDQIPVTERRECINAAVTFLARMTGHAVAVYLGSSWIQDDLENQYPILTGHERLWIADYRATEVPPLPKPFTAWTFWQHGTGPVPGVPAMKVDLNRFIGTADDLDQLNRPFART